MGETKIITLNHGSGGKLTHDLIENLFLKYFKNKDIITLTDSAIVPSQSSHLAFTTDGYVVEPIFFPGGNIGKLAVCGTVNDLAVSGAKPAYLSCSFIIEEGLTFDELEKIVVTMAEEASKAGVNIVTGDTKVVHKGKGDKIFITASGIGFVDEDRAKIGSADKAKEGDKIIVTGSLGDHAIAILSSRESLTFETPVVSDCASLNGLIEKALEACPNISFMRDATRGGAATVLCELAEKTGKGIIIYEKEIPVKESVMAICEMFGFDPLFLANEGKAVIVVPANDADKVLQILQMHELGKDAAIIGEITAENPRKVILKTSTGGKRWIDMPSGAQLPRIC
ncbi:MAG TPA: hydrogenase expression/formation protein HypE [Bacteroidales bacterium]|nr:hydrogenase expression/formation protein HypE [Bacteroidales bacterium]